MYDSVEVDISEKLMRELSKKCKERNMPIAIIGGWATYFYVNQTYRSAFGKGYMGSRDIDVCIDSSKEKDFKELIEEIGFTKNGYKFRWEKIYSRVTEKFITQEEAKKEEIFNITYIFLDIFCDCETSHLYSWCLKSLKGLKHFIINDLSFVDIDTLIDLKCVALFTRDKSDKENKDACDLYALLNYSNKTIKSTKLLTKAIEKILGRQDLIYVIAQHVLLDAGKQSIVIHALNAKLKSFVDKGSK